MGHKKYSPPEFDESVLAKWQKLTTDGKKIRGDLTTFDFDNPPDWYDPEKLKRCQKFSLDYTMSFSQASFEGLTLLVQLQYILAPLLQTKNSESIPALYRRYLHTGFHFLTWLREDLTSPDAAGYKDLMRVRKMHTAIYEKMNSLYPCEDGKVWVSQYDMVITQFALIGFLITAPSKYGLHDPHLQDQVIETVCYGWRVNGLMLGIKDEFNMCSGSLDEVKQFSHLILQHVYLPLLRRQGSATGIHMSSSIATSLESLFPLKISFDPSLLSLCDAYNIEDEFRPRLTTFADKLTYRSLNFIFSLHSTWCLKLLGRQMIKLLDRAKADQTRVAKKLEQKHSQVLYSLEKYIQDEHEGQLKLLHESDIQARGKCPFSRAQ